MRIRDCGTNVIHPDKVMDVETLARKYLSSNNVKGGYYSQFIAIGGGTKKSYYHDFKFDRELSRIYTYFKIKGIPVKNIAVIDYNKDICKQWKSLGISAFTCRWGAYDKIKKIKEELRSFNTRSPYTFLYANHFGREEDVRHHRQWLDIFNPKIFAALYTTRRSFTIDAVVKDIQSYKDYEPCDLSGINRDYKAKGLLPYRGLCMAVLKKRTTWLPMD